MSDSTLKTYLRTLRTPNGAPQTGRVCWEQTDLLGGQCRVVVSWSPDELVVEGQMDQQPWRILAQRGEQGWQAQPAQAPVRGGTCLAQLRWAAGQIKHIAQAAGPTTSWDVPRAGRRPKP